MATGPDGGAYQEVGKRYQEVLGRHGITLELRPTAGALENLTLLRDPRSGVGIGLLQGGITNQKESPDLGALGTVFYEPLWFFHRGALEGRDLEALRGKKISIGPEGSGTRALVLQLLARQRLNSGLRPAARALPPGGRRRADPRRDRRGPHAGGLGLPGRPPAAHRGRHHARELPPRRHVRGAVPLPQQAHGARGRGRHGEEPAAGGGDPLRAEGQPGGAQGLAPRDPVLAPRCGGAGPFRAGNLPPDEAVPGRGSGRPAPDRRGAPVLPLGPAVPSASPALLARGRDRPGSSSSSSPSSA